MKMIDDFNGTHVTIPDFRIETNWYCDSGNCGGESHFSRFSLSIDVATAAFANAIVDVLLVDFHPE